MTPQIRILFVGAGPAQMPAIRHARNLGYMPYAIDADPDAAGFDYSVEFDVGDIRDPEFIKLCAVRYKVNAIVGIATDVAVPSVARACAALGLPAIPVEAADISVNKLLQRNSMKAAGLRVPLFKSFQNTGEAQKYATQIGFPVVIKPSDAAGSRGVSLVQNADELIQAADAAIAVSRSKVCIVESYIDGVEVSVEGFVVGGRFHSICLSEKICTPPPYLLDTEVHFPDSLSQVDRTSVLELANNAVVACGLDNCPVHMELLLSSKGPFVVELAARGAGFRVFTNILPYVTGLDTVDLQIRLALGVKITVSSKEPLKGAVIAFLSPKPGNLKHIEGLEQARKISGVQEAEVYIKPGTIMGELKCGADRVGHLIVFGETKHAAEESAMKALNLIKLIVE